MRDDGRVGRGGRERDADAGFHRLDAGDDLQEGRADCLEGSGAPSGFSGRGIAHVEHRPVGGGVQEQPELVGLPAMAGGAVGGEVGFVLLDPLPGSRLLENDEMRGMFSIRPRAQ